MRRELETQTTTIERFTLSHEEICSLIRKQFPVVEGKAVLQFNGSDEDFSATLIVTRVNHETCPSLEVPLE